MPSQKSLTSGSIVNCHILGKPEDLKTNVLLTINDLLKYYLHLKEKSYKQKPRGLSPRIVDDVMQIWKISSFPTLSKPRVTELMRKRLDEYFDLKKNVNSKVIENFKKNWQSFAKALGHYMIYQLANANVIDKNKVTREKQKLRKQYMDLNESANVISLYFDDRKDCTLLMEEWGTKRIRREVIEEHVTVLAEPRSR